MKALDGGDTDARYEVGILAVGFFRATPTRIASQVEHGREALLSAAGADFGGGRREYIGNEQRIPSRSQSNGHGIGRPLGSDMSMETFVVEQDRDLQARIFFHPFLNRVGEFGHRARTTILARTRYLAEAVLQ